MASITVNFLSEQVQVTKNLRGDIIDGDSNQILEISENWTFNRNLKIKIQTGHWIRSRKVNKIFPALLVVFSLFKLNLDSKQLLHPEISLFQEKLEIKNLDEFFIFLKQICSSQILFKNLKKHSSYPKFGSTKNWKKVCKKVNDDSLDKKEFLKKKF